MITLVQGWRSRNLTAVAVLGAILPLSALPLTPPAGDALLAASAVSLGAFGAYLVRVRRYVEQLPLEIAPLGGSGVVNGIRVYRFRFRLGRGRPFRNLVVRVVFQPDAGGSPAELSVGSPQGLLYGPVTIVASDPLFATVVPGRFLLSGSCESADQRWDAKAEIHSSAIREGSFGGIDVRNGRVEFSSDWTAVTAKERSATPPKR